MHKFLYPVILAKSDQDPPGSFEEGSIYYNENLGTMRHFQDGSWRFLPYFGSHVGMPTPLLVSGLRVCPYTIGVATTTSVTMSNNTTYWIPFTVNRKVTVSQIAISVRTAKNGSSQNIGIYSSYTNNLYPKNLLVSLTLSSASTGTIIGNLFNSLTLYPNLYWIAIGSSGNPTLDGVNAGSTRELARSGTSALNHYRSSGSTLPSSANEVSFTPSLSNLPLILLTISF